MREIRTSGLKRGRGISSLPTLLVHFFPGYRLYLSQEIPESPAEFLVPTLERGNEGMSIPVMSPSES